MAFVDELNIHISAGKGGDGVLRFRHEKGKEFAGPSGGDGGRGGSVYLIGSRDLGLLFKYRHEKKFAAQDGEAGKKDSLHGANGDDLVLKLPIGSIVTNKETGKAVHVLTEDKPVLLLKGGDGVGTDRFGLGGGDTMDQNEQRDAGPRDESCVADWKARQQTHLSALACQAI